MKNRWPKRNMSPGQEHELLLKFYGAGLCPKLAQRIIDSPDNALAKKIIRVAYANGILSKGTEHLVRVSPDEGLIIPATQGKRAMSDAKDVFPGYIDPDFKKWKANELDESRPQTIVDVYEQMSEKDGDFSQLFGSLGKKEDLDLTHDQIITFCETYPDWLHPILSKGCATLFLSKFYRKFFVVATYYWRNARSRQVEAINFDNSTVLRSSRRHRLVVPRLA